jgi:hypothetical protein
VVGITHKHIAVRLQTASDQPDALQAVPTQCQVRWMYWASSKQSKAASQTVHLRPLVISWAQLRAGAATWQGSSMDMLLSPQKQLQKQLPPDIAMAGAQWGCYSSPAALDGLLDWLNPKGEKLHADRGYSSTPCCLQALISAAGQARGSRHCTCCSRNRQ